MTMTGSGCESLAHSQDVDGHGAAGGEEHDVAVDVVVPSREPLHGGDE